jgi:hypothetical protein
MITFEMFKQFVNTAILTGSFSYVKDGKKLFWIESLFEGAGIELKTWDEQKEVTVGHCWSFFPRTITIGEHCKLFWDDSAKSLIEKAFINNGDLGKL